MTFHLSTDRAAMQVDRIHAVLAASYWSPGIPRATVARAIAGSWCIGAFADGGEQVGFARVITDHATFAYLADVYVDPAQQRQGIAAAMLARIDAEPALQGLRRWLLATRDAHRLYARFGWQAVAEPGILMQRLDADVYRRTLP